MISIFSSVIITFFPDAFSGIDELNATLECGQNDSYGNLALTLEDLAEIVQSVGIEALAKELGIELDFIDESWGVFAMLYDPEHINCLVS